MAVNKEVIEHLKQTIEDSPDTQELHLEFMHIDDLLPYMELLAQLKHLRKLSLHGNRLKQLPIDMSRLAQLQELDLTNNVLNDADLAIMSLKTLPNLQVLAYEIRKDKQQTIAEELPQLAFLNKVPVVRQKTKQKFKFKYMNKNELQNTRRQLSTYFRKIIQFQNTYLEQKQQGEDTSEQKFKHDMNNIINEALKKINEKGEDATQALENIIYNITKFEMYDLLKIRAMNICMDIYGDLGKFVRDLNDQQDNLFKAVAEQGLQLVKCEYQLKEIELEREQNEKVSLQNRLYNKNHQLEKELKRIKKQRDDLIAEMSQLESQNKKYLDMIVRHSRGQKSILAGLQLGAPSHSSKPFQAQSTIPTHIVKPLDKPRSTFREPFSQTNYASNGRTLTLKQLKDTIEQIYESKLKFDQKNFDGRIARQTMHQYLFTYLNQKYGLKNLTIEAASSIVAGIQAYSAEDNDVAVFGKILRNQVDEQFRNVQTELKATISNLLKMHIKSQMPYKSANEIQDVYNQKTNGQISAEESQDIIKYLYNKTDSERILHKLQMLFKISKPKQQAHHRRFTRDESMHQEKGKRKIKFTIFLQAVLDFQLKNHEKLLKPLVNVFKLRDTDADGILNEEQFISVIEELCEEASQILPELLMIVDPYQIKSITFTQVVRLVANYPENNPILSRFLTKDQILQEYE